jgi:halimadienyl-diphosphate synthase
MTSSTAATGLAPARPGSGAPPADQPAPADPHPHLAQTTDRVGLAARQLLGTVLHQPWGKVSASIYETGRLVALAPWLPGHAARVGFLAASQHPDGSWGRCADGYQWVPTLSATEATLTESERPQLPGQREQLRQRAARGLRALAALGDRAGAALPDTPAIEIIVPALLGALNRRLSGDGAAGPVLSLPEGAEPRTLAAVSAHLGAGLDIPVKLHHCLEVLGRLGAGGRSIRPVVPGTVGASPAATAAWLVDRGVPDPVAMRYLQAVTAEHGGPAPSVVPITNFERAWVVSGLLGAGMEVAVPAALRVGLEASLRADGTNGGAGLPPDADTTAVSILALDLLGVRTDPDCLFGYQAGDHFCTWPGERTASVSVNAHVLDAFGRRRAGIGSGPEGGDRYAPARRTLVGWLVGQQGPDGSWSDKWHASPYYATGCAAVSLHRYGVPDPGCPAAAAAVRAAVGWVLHTERPAGGWGRWGSTPEETAYALHILLLTAGAGYAEPARVAAAVARGVPWLTGTGDPALWHDKDLYYPAHVVTAVVLAARHLAARHLAARHLAARHLSAAREAAVLRDTVLEGRGTAGGGTAGGAPEPGREAPHRVARTVG